MQRKAPESKERSLQRESSLQACLPGRMGNIVIGFSFSSNNVSLPLNGDATLKIFQAYPGCTKKHKSASKHFVVIKVPLWACRLGRAGEFKALTNTNRVSLLEVN